MTEPTRRPTRIAPSILSCDFARLGEEIAAIDAAGADVVHLDVMDGHFVPNLTVGLPIVRAARRSTALPIDCHLMITNAADYVERYAEAGADWISVHVEACAHLHRTLAAIRGAGARAGVVLNPHTSDAAVAYVLEAVDFVLVMSVNPGFGGQSFIEAVLPKVERLRERIVRAGVDVDIEIDGGIGAGTIRRARDAGANVFVAGSGVFGEGGGTSIAYAERIAALRAAADGS